MNFNFGNLASAAVGAVVKVAVAIVNAIAEAVLGASAAVAEAREDGELSDEQAEELFEEKFKALLGAYMLSLGSGSSSDPISISDAFSALNQDISNGASEIINESKSWLNSTEPTILFNIPDSNSVIPAMISGSIGSFTEAISKVERKAIGYLDGNDLKLYPSSSDVKMNPYKNVKKIGTAATVVTTALDIGNTWSKDDGNTNLKRLEKTGIQVAGTITSLGVGYLSGEVAASGVAASPETAGLSLAAVPAAASIDIYSAQGISYAQDKLYDKLDIKK